MSLLYIIIFNLPFQAASTHPAYLTADTEYVIYKEDKKLVDSSPLNDIIDIDFDSDEEELIHRLVHGDNKQIKMRFKVLQPETWPTAEELSFNDSQYEAYRLALTHEFAVIQGPPGTGKTFIAINVAKTLLQNVSSEGHCLMLIICYTNHALDQFLEAISHITQSIVRIGGQSRNKAMDQFNLSNLRRQALTPDLRSINSFFIDQKNQLKYTIQDFQVSLKTLDILNNGVLRYQYLQGKNTFRKDPWVDVDVDEDDDTEIPGLRHLENYYKNKRIYLNDPLEHWLFEAVLGYGSEYERNIDDILLEYDNLMNNEEDFDNRRAELILDEEKPSHDQKVLESLLGDKASFLLSDAKAEIRRLIGFSLETDDFHERYQVQRAIQELDSRINLFNVSFTFVSSNLLAFVQ